MSFSKVSKVNISLQSWEWCNPLRSIKLLDMYLYTFTCFVMVFLYRYIHRSYGNMIQPTGTEPNQRDLGYEPTNGTWPKSGWNSYQPLRVAPNMTVNCPCEKGVLSVMFWSYTDFLFFRNLGMLFLLGYELLALVPQEWHREARSSVRVMGGGVLGRCSPLNLGHCYRGKVPFGYPMAPNHFQLSETWLPFWDGEWKRDPNSKANI